MLVAVRMMAVVVIVATLAQVAWLVARGRRVDLMLWVSLGLVVVLGGLTIWTLIIGHGTFCIVVVYNNALARFRRLSPSMIEASMDLGANGTQTFRHVILPQIGSALLAGGMLAFALEHANLLGQAVALALQLFGAGLQGLAFAFQSTEGVHIQKGLRIFTGLQTRHGSVQIFAEKNNIKHACIVVNPAGAPLGDWIAALRSR